MKAIFTAGFLALTLSMSVEAASITFEELGTKSGLFDVEPALNSQYSGQGITFDGGWEVLNQSGNFGVNALSGSHFAAFNTNVNGITNTLGMAFDTNINSMSGFLGGNFATTWTISAFLNGSNIYQTSILSTAQQYINFSLSSLVADYVTILSSSNSGVLDDLSYNNVSAVPVPAAVFLFAPALLGFMGLRRKAKNTVA